MLCLSGFELYSRWVPLRLCRLRIFLNVSFLFINFFILIFLACDIKKKKKKKRKARIGAYKGDGLVKNLLLHVSVFKSVPVSFSRKGELCTIISIFSQPLLVLFQEWRGALETGMYVVTCSSSPLPRWWHIYEAVSFTKHANLTDLSS